MNKGILFRPDEIRRVSISFRVSTLQARGLAIL